MPRPAGKSSRIAYRSFLKDYRSQLIDDGEEKRDGSTPDRRREFVREYFRWLLPHRWAVGSLFALALAGAICEMVEPLFMRFIVDRVLLNKNISDADRLPSLNFAGLLFVILVIGTNLVNAFKGYNQRLVNTRIMLSLRRSLFDRMIHLPLPSLWDMKTGGILSRLTGDVDTTTGLMQMAIVSPSISVIRLIIAIAVLMNLNWRLALTALAIIPGIMVISFIFAKRIRPIYRSLRKDAEKIDGRVGETFSGIRVVRTFRRESHELAEYLRGRHTVLRKEMFAQRREMIIWTTWGLIMGTVNVVIVWYGGYLNLRGSASIGDIMAFQWYTFLLLNPIWNIVNTFSELQRSLAAMERVFAVLAMQEDKPDKPGAVDAPAKVDDLRFDNVTFEYREGRPVVQEFDVHVPGGSVVALVGRSGAGKTTITDLLARFHDPTSGRILLNGTDVRDLRLQTYRRLFAIVQQDVFLFDGTVRDNIAYGRRDATDAEVEDASRRANAHEFIDTLPERYDTSIGERGVKLSGGQQQRLAIARAILADPQILILDEATSNLDTESEQLIQAAMDSLLAGRTTFVIAHRLSTVRQASLILLVDNGRIIERGTHEELMSQRGLYQEMVLRQMASHGDAEQVLR